VSFENLLIIYVYLRYIGDSMYRNIFGAWGVGGVLNAGKSVYQCLNMSIIRLYL